jgi:hypothetical protein
MQKLDVAVMKKFDELGDKAKKVSASQQVTDVAAVVDSRLFQEWATGVLSLFQKVFGEKSVHYRNFQAVHDKIINLAYQESFDTCRAIFQAAREEYEKGELCDIRMYLEQGVLDYLAGSTLDYLRRNDKETACILAGVLLENALKLLCARKGIPAGSLEQMTDALYQAGSYQVGTQQRIKDWNCMKEDFVNGYGEKYRAIDVEEMLRGVNRFISRELPA